MQRLLIILVISSSFLASACTIHNIDIQQGNLVTQEMLEQVSTGMDKHQVQGILGTPLIEDPFHANRWDYIYSPNTRKGIENNSHVTLYFDGGTLSRIEVRRPLPREAD